MLFLKEVYQYRYMLFLKKVYQYRYMLFSFYEISFRSTSLSYAKFMTLTATSYAYKAMWGLVSDLCLFLFVPVERLATPL
jgi:hypothetical protein